VDDAVEAVIGETPGLLALDSLPCHDRLRRFVEKPAVMNNCPMPNGTGHGPRRQRHAPSLAKRERSASPAARYQTPTANIGRGSERHEAKKPRLKTICQRPGSIQRCRGAKRKSTK
jgi:hypothetical protein